jgi:peptidoglycan/LPS O-acetylase OafA/YrhL
LSWGLGLHQSLGTLPGREKYYQSTINNLVVAGIITAFFVIMLLVSLRRTGVLAAIQWTALGALTYPLFLLHQYVGYMVFNITYPAISPHLLLFGTIAMVLGLAYAVHVFVEKKASGPIKSGFNKGLDGVFGFLFSTQATSSLSHLVQDQHSPHEDVSPRE